MPKFVVQEHQARTHHFDLRLEREGVFKGWVVLKDMPEPRIKRLTVQLEDQGLCFGNFEGAVPGSQYGGDEARIWKGGNYERKTSVENCIAFTLRTKIPGTFNVVKFRSGNPLYRPPSSKAPAETVAEAK